MPFPCGNHRINLSQPNIMGIINLSPDSFSSRGRVASLDQGLRQTEQYLKDGATFIDVGGEPTNPVVSADKKNYLSTEFDVVLPLIERLVKEVPVPISIDTSQPEVMQAAISLGVSMINDVRSLQVEGALEIVSKRKVGVCLMHNCFPFGHSHPIAYPIGIEDPVTDIIHFLENQIKRCQRAGITKDRIVVDPGFGGGSFGKTPAQNLMMLNQLEKLKVLACPVLIGVSRKSFIGEVLNVPVDQRIVGSVVAAVIAMMKGANIIRTHDVKETAQAAKMMRAITGNKVLEELTKSYKNIQGIS